MDKKTQRYFKRLVTGKTILARCIDAIVGKLFCFVAIFAAAWLSHIGLLNSVIIAFMVTALISIFLHARKKLQWDKQIAKKLREIRNRLALEKLILLENSDEFMAEVFTVYTGIDEFKMLKGGFYDAKSSTFCMALPNHPRHDVDVQQMTEIARLLKKVNAKRIALLSASDYSQEARSLAARLDGVELLSRKELYELLENTTLYPTEEEAILSIKQEAESLHSKERLKKEFLSRKKAGAYAFSALLLTVWPFIVGWNLIYPIMSTLCVVMAFYSFASVKKSGSN